MNCCVTDLRDKEVINTKNGCRIGYVSDVEICCETGSLTAIIIWGRGGLFRLSGKGEDIRIPWCDIKVIGEETVLVCADCSMCERKRGEKKGFFDFFFRE